MKNLVTYLFIGITFLVCACTGGGEIKSRPVALANVENAMQNTEKQGIYDFKIKTLDGKKEISLAQYKGKKMLLVNVASKCGYTPQYAELQKLHEQYGDKVVVLGFPCNDFGGQEPGESEEIASFCKLNYGVTFQLFEKISVKKGEGQHPLYKWLSSKELNGWNEDAPSWNFSKYLISEKGELLKFYPSKVKPMSDEILAAIQ
ncbi:glutathione peroxidase [Thermoflexibacter ruber]|uniref:Glutathione peroxidase n=1 Tax=Thermoflexibacter ruber TaxID=1003 RepID=A0A1I2FKH8_9BACT|nr:glutathione peroxidase [Thermoflexibacter ruber]